MDELGRLRAFNKVVERGSLSRAARDLGVTQPTVSKAIAALEATVRARLLQRTTRTVVVTDAGRRFYERTRAALESLELAQAELSERDVPRGPLRIHGPVALGELYLSPIAVAFQRKYPGVRCELTLLDSFVDLVAEGADLAVRMGRVDDPSIVRRRLGVMERLLVASPAYVKRRGLPRHPSELGAHEAVRFSGLASGDALTLGGAGGPHQLRVPSAFLSNNATALKDALVGGLGVGNVTRWLVQDALDARQLQIVLPDFPPEPLEVHVLYPSARFIPPRARAFTDFLATRLLNTPGLMVEAGAARP